MADSGTVYLVGAGPGAPGLLTQKAAFLLQKADVVVHDGLVSEAILALVSPSAERMYAGKKRSADGPPRTQDDINRLLVELAKEHSCVVRLKGGDPFVFGRGAEECQALAAAGVRFETVPGISALSAVPAYAGIPLTARGYASSATMATGHEAAGKLESDVDWQGLAQAQTIVLFMAVKTLGDCCRRLVAAGRSPTTPCALIRWGTTAAQEVVVGTLEDIAEKAQDMKPPALFIAGEVVSLRDSLSWVRTQPLFGLRLLLTRGADRAGEYTRALSALGAEPLPVAVTEFADPRVPPSLGDVSTYDWLAFASATAVERFFHHLYEDGADARALAGVRCACVGPATERALRQAGIVADVVASRKDAAGLADAVKAHGAVGKVLVPRAEDGRSEGIDSLVAAGGQVTSLPVYRTVARATAADDLKRIAERGINGAAFLAPSQVNAFFDALGAQAGSLLASCAVVAAIGRTTADALVSRGVASPVVATQPGAQALAKALCHAYAKEQS